MSGTGLMVVPVRSGSGTVSLRCGRLPGGERVGIAFTTEARLVEAMGADQAWIRIHERAMRAMLAPLGVTRLQVDPRVVAATPSTAGFVVPAAV
ncbi:SAV_915 family protein [Actinoallomurus acaciae]|uniref:SAV_915 family protein n=1 Tax=Actinoallomurus acaciae TaxID=502577 RepID=A0ABV5YRH1_9ACTN